MSKIIYKYTLLCSSHDIPDNIRWLSEEDYDIFAELLLLCSQKELGISEWSDAYKSGTSYCGLFVGGKMTARACVEKYSETAWEVGDVRCVSDFRNRGFAHQVCSFVLRYILSQGKIADIRTEDDNIKMKK